MDVLGLTFRKDLFMANSQTFPSPPDSEKSLTRLQERLMKKLGEHAHPFTFEVASRWRVDRPTSPGLLGLSSHLVPVLGKAEPGWLSRRTLVLLILSVPLILCFVFSQIPLNLPCSVTLQPGPEDTGKVRTSLVGSKPLGSGRTTDVLCVQACGVDFEVNAFCAENPEEKIHKR